MKRGSAVRRVVSVLPGNGWRFVRTKDGEEYCVELLMFEQGKVTELACYCFDEGGGIYPLHPRPEEIDDMSEISDLLGEEKNGAYMYVFSGKSAAA
jgi:hypothetical protein